MPCAPPSHTAPIVLTDGTCNFCNASVRWIAARDRRGVFRFAALQSNIAQTLIAQSQNNQHGVVLPLPDSVILLDGSGVWSRSEAILRLCALLGFPWSIAAVGRVLPAALRDWLYDFFAVHRYRWFGKTEQCVMPTASLRARILTDPPVFQSHNPLLPATTLPTTLANTTADPVQT